MGKALKIIIWVVVVVVGILLAIQYINAAKYQALVQVIKEDRIGVNPTGDALDFGDLPRNKSAVRTVTLKSDGDTAGYIIIWKFGDISDLLKVNRNYFTLAPHTTEKLEFSLYVPNSAEFRYYKGRTIIFQIPKLW
ncbi:MAG: hypothetical protein A2W52_01465 [Candidatus Taylorbacteria bacterium RIFCSPHIGHO2_02_49_25]|uniref:Uncharacterized protein n=1 Tax=Candidatus Taylorbacteria bacterium RIFCSPHIGHO2_02_49_25 TaxID=1802305 RepID=A0A1G2MDH8_9BACT|nr:MAG: hypothetical protein A2759_03390 [Candidatus Taylorbacteria bacterium RIFCSPHIGHO2_01_FULL_49_60]OHA21928.1 MAG: hypothetical protein A2W52_01465 [Candidatus Taylorbacteria bacterium RIFCSPHIGHO2_02_49_25]OHA35288.1 MAG: hypothetical protein A2W65_04595 [Candidatus Taylorbacteria bacterium RIFCSPLOWO2_02_50_13]OHA36555.1 MAG: hypothetical protein A3B27_02015 [Candidatus Taylorbacteria bacterium RIFCSPLOWO2_01_FULL_50_130]OHA41972.1 MAG: hypothetical protein A3H73_00060 [Candidatus Taylo